ncbi:hypothetical protein GCM10023238_20960 [Streptomyces heliomycini]
MTSTDTAPYALRIITSIATSSAVASHSSMRDAAGAEQRGAAQPQQRGSGVAAAAREDHADAVRFSRG